MLQVTSCGYLARFCHPSLGYHPSCPSADFFCRKISLRGFQSVGQDSFSGGLVDGESGRRVVLIRRTRSQFSFSGLLLYSLAHICFTSLVYFCLSDRPHRKDILVLSCQERNDPWLMCARKWMTRCEKLCSSCEEHVALLVSNKCRSGWRNRSPIIMWA